MRDCYTCDLKKPDVRFEGEDDKGKAFYLCRFCIDHPGRDHTATQNVGPVALSESYQPVPGADPARVWRNAEGRRGYFSGKRFFVCARCGLECKDCMCKGCAFVAIACGECLKWRMSRDKPAALGNYSKPSNMFWIIDPMRSAEPDEFGEKWHSPDALQAEVHIPQGRKESASDKPLITDGGVVKAMAKRYLPDAEHPAKLYKPNAGPLLPFTFDDTAFAAKARSEWTGAPLPSDDRVHATPKREEYLSVCRPPVLRELTSDHQRLFFTGVSALSERVPLDRAAELTAEALTGASRACEWCIDPTTGKKIPCKYIAAESKLDKHERFNPEPTPPFGVPWKNLSQHFDKQIRVGGAEPYQDEDRSSDVLPMGPNYHKPRGHIVQILSAPYPDGDKPPRDQSFPSDQKADAENLDSPRRWSTFNQIVSDLNAADDSEREEDDEARVGMPSSFDDDDDEAPPTEEAIAEDVRRKLEAEQEADKGGQLADPGAFDSEIRQFDKLSESDKQHAIIDAGGHVCPDCGQPLPKPKGGFRATKCTRCGGRRRKRNERARKRALKSP